MRSLTSSETWIYLKEYSRFFFLIVFLLPELLFHTPVLLVAVVRLQGGLRATKEEEEKRKCDT